MTRIFEAVTRIAVRLVMVVGLLVVFLLTCLFLNIASLFGPGDINSAGSQTHGTRDPSYDFCYRVAALKSDVAGYVSKFGNDDLETFLLKYNVPDINMNRLARFAATKYWDATYPDLPNRDNTKGLDEAVFMERLISMEEYAGSCLSDLKDGTGTVTKLYAALGR